MPLRFALLLTLLMSPAALSQPGMLDPTFGADGIALSPDGGFLDVAQTADGGFVGVGVGDDNDPFVASFRADGSLVNASYPFDPGDFHPILLNVAVLPGGGILVTGGTPSDEDGLLLPMFVLRLTESLVLDPSFGVDGFVYFDGAQAPALTNMIFSGAPVAVGADGSIYVTGQLSGGPIVLGLVRLFSDGAVDTGFGFEEFGGAAAIGFVGDEQGLVFPAGIAVDEDGRIAIAGSLLDAPVAAAAAFAARFKADGEADGTFDGDGLAVVTAPSGFNIVLDFVLTASGDLLLSGSSSETEEETTAYVLRLTPSGTPDASFGAGGFAYAPGPSGASQTFGGLAEDASGRVVLGAQVGTDGDGEPFLFRFLTSGEPDASFGTGGAVQFAVAGGGASPFSLLAQGDDAVLAGITTPDDPDAGSAGFLARIVGSTGSAAEPGATTHASRSALVVGQPYPNPTAGPFALSLASASASSRVEVFDALGRRVVVAHDGVMAREEVQVDLSGLPAGLYLVRATDGERSVTRRVVKR